MDDYEEFSESQLAVLNQFVTNTDSNVFVLRNLPEVIKGALFSRYSRSTLGLRSLLLKDFILNEDMAFESIAQVGTDQDSQVMAIKKAQNFYDRILDGYGDDSIGELGGAHLAVENVSMLAAKVLEDSRIGGSPLEKSTRYVYFDQKIDGEYLFYREPILMTSSYRESYLKTCNMLFDVYGKLIPELTNHIEENSMKDESASKAAYTAALRAKVLDCLRGLLPASTFTNLGIFANGRFFEYLISKLHCHNLAEMQEVGAKAHHELSKVIPSFIRRSELGHKNQQSFAKFSETMQAELKLVTSQQSSLHVSEKTSGVNLIESDPNAVVKVAAALMYSNSDVSLFDLEEYCKKLPKEEIARIFDAACNARENRRHKSPRALERAFFTFEIVSDFAAYRDLQRHRMLTQDKQLLTCDYGYYVPKELIEAGLEETYSTALDEAKEVFDSISSELPEEAQYVVPMANHLRWYFTVNLRALQWLCELRSSAAGHPSYRLVAQEMAKAVFEAYPEFECFFKFVDFAGYDLGRLDQEQRKQEKQGSMR